MQWIAEPKMDYEKLINCLERKTADTHELHAASAIIGLRQRVQELEKECDKELARNRPLRNLIASLEEQKSHWNKQRDEYREAVSTMDSERSANATLTAERGALLEANRIACEDLVERHDRIAELKQQRDELINSAEFLIKAMAGTQAETDFAFSMFILEDTIASVKEKQNGI